jgi:cytochrome P450
MRRTAWRRGGAFAAAPDFGALSRLRFTRDVFREALRLYPPVPMMVRENTAPNGCATATWRPGAQVVLALAPAPARTDLGRPDAFDPDRWQTEAKRRLRRFRRARASAPARDGLILPFSGWARARLHRGGLCDGRALPMSGLPRAFLPDKET